MLLNGKLLVCSILKNAHLLGSFSKNDLGLEKKFLALSDLVALKYATLGTAGY